MQVLLDKTLNIISIQENGLLIHSTCLYPFYSPDGTKVAFWVQDYDYQNDTYLSTYQLYCKNLITNDLFQINSGNGSCPLPPNTTLNELVYNAAFSPDGSKILFLTTSTNLIPADTILSAQNPSGNRWYVYDFVDTSFTRVSSTSSVFGNNIDRNEALWYDNDNVVFVTLSNNLVSGININSHYEVYMKNISSGNIIHVSRKEDTNITPYFIGSCINIAVAPNKVSFYSYELGFVIKNMVDTSIQRVQELPEILGFGIVTPETLTWSDDGTKMLFRITTGTSITSDTNGLVDDFVYDFSNDTIIPLNENSLETIYGNGYSKNATFSPDGTKVAFISNSYNIDPSSTNPIDNLYFKDLDTRILTRVSKSATNGNISSNVLGYTWVTNDTLAFTSFSNDIVSGDTNTDVDWFFRDTQNNTTIRINYNMNQQLFSSNNQYEGVIRKAVFNNVGTRILFTTKLKTLNPTFYTPSYDEYDIFEKIFIEEYVSFPTSINHSVEANDAINSYVENGKLLAYTVNDSITGTPTYSIVGSAYVERVNSIRYKNDSSNIRWMSFNYPNLPFDTPVPAKIGVGLFNSSNTLLDDIIDIKQNSVTTTQNPVYGTMAIIPVRPQNDIVLVSAGDDQQRICDPIVYLESTVIGNMSGHTFLWELISGDPITLLIDSQTQAHYVIDGSSRDRIFRFWIDKGKYNEQYKDVIIYSTPTDIFKNNDIGIETPLNVAVSNDSNLYVMSYSLIGSDYFDYNIPFNSSGTYNLYASGIEWSLPLAFYETDTDAKKYYRSAFLYTTLETNINGYWETLHVSTINDSRTYQPLIVGVPFRIGSVFDINGVATVYYTNVDYSSSSMTANLVASQMTCDTSINATKTSTIYVISDVVGSDNVTTINTMATSDIVYNRTNTIYVMEPVSGEDNITTQYATVHTGLNFTIFRYNGAVIGG